MIELCLGLLILGDWFFTNRENIMFAVQTQEYSLLKENV